MDYEYLQSTYFFLDEFYRNNLYPLIVGTRNPPLGRKLVDIEVYKSTLRNETGNFQGIAVPDPGDPFQLANFDSVGGEKSPFKRLERNVDYTVDEFFGYIRMNRRVDKSDILAVKYADEDGRQFGGSLYFDGNDTLRTLKLIKKKAPLPTDPTWDLEMKNIYYLGATGINEEGFELKIVYDKAAGEALDRLDGTNYLQIFGIDSMDVNNTRTIDEIVDIQNGNIVNLARGELWFPHIEPFGSNTGPIGTPALPDSLVSEDIYHSTIRDDIYAASKFKIVASYKNRSSVISMGFGVIEGSEEIRLDGVLLNRGTDYAVDYFSGTLTLIREGATDPGANLDVKYETNQLFQLDKEALLGTRAEYKFGDNSFIGGTFLYYSKSTIDQKVRVGEEPVRNMLWDVNGKFSAEPDFITRAANALPLINTDTRSKFSLEGEIAQVLPNPNTLNNKNTGDNEGVAYVDDFESSKRTTSLPPQRRHWTLASPPVGFDNESRGFSHWYNPFHRVPIVQIWPDRDVTSSSGVGSSGNNLTDVLTIGLDPVKNEFDYADDSIPPDQRWGGVMRALSPGFYDQTQSKFLEVWVRGFDGKLNIDFGFISEDANGNGLLDTEDEPTPGAPFGNELLDPDEDHGIDNCTDEFETGDAPVPPS